jgi:hypothetical protein
MAGTYPHFDPSLLRELETARERHLETLRCIPLADKELFAEACKRYEAQVEAIMRSAAERRPRTGHIQGAGGDGEGETSRGSRLS